ncbi:MAG: hypothetical protein R2722_06725 [Tessaracoccus sp.]
MNLSRLDAQQLYLLGFLALLVLILAVNGWGRARERRGDWGPGFTGTPLKNGYLPADLRSSAPATIVESPEERWLLGLAAPFVEQAGLLHDRWSLVPAFCDEAWQRRLAAVAGQWGVRRGKDWKAAVADVEQRLATLNSHADAPDLRAYLTARLAMLLRLGVAARFTDAPGARRQLTQAARPLRKRYSDWLGYGDAIVAATNGLAPETTINLRADMRTLYADGGPWKHLSWPE